MPQLDVVIPVYNEEAETVRQTVAAIQAAFNSDSVRIIVVATVWHVVFFY